MTGLKIGIVGVTGRVGTEFLSLLAERRTPLIQLRGFASDRSQGMELTVPELNWSESPEASHQHLVVESLQEGCFRGLDLVFFSSGDDISAEWAPRAVYDGAFAIDNSAAFRMNPEIKLVVPEVNWPEPTSLWKQPSIIANPNCSTIQLVLALKPLSQIGMIERVWVATYQAVSGAGAAGITELDASLRHQLADGASQTFSPQVFAHPIASNCIPEIGSMTSDGFFSEENKIRLESAKILSLRPNTVSAFCVRVPIPNAHSEVVWVQYQDPVQLAVAQKQIESAEGVDYWPWPSQSGQYPTASFYSGRNPVGVGRLMQPHGQPNTLMFWVVADNLRKGAALNGLQIAERLFDITPRA